MREKKQREAMGLGHVWDLRLALLPHRSNLWAGSWEKLNVFRLAAAGI